MNSAYNFKSIAVSSHHVKNNICGSRAKYREGRKDTAIKVYTVNQESVYLLMTDVPAVGAGEELRALCDQYGIVERFQPVDDYPTEEFTETYLIKFSSFASARAAKKRLDDKSFFGNNLHVFYAPEFETVLETKLKLQERRKYVAWKTNTGKKVQSKPSVILDQQPTTYIWAGREYTVPPSIEMTVNVDKPRTSGMFVPRQCKSSVGKNSFITNVKDGQNLILSKSQKFTEDPSYQQTISHVRAKVSKVSVPNVRVSLKRKKRL